ncbi:IS21 family transposase [Eoetvoesiella caeni]|uniref:IS21 family transposase n=2 Tax=Eoetvoesiella caeni TaxID=645616 RepID=UPI00363C4B4C
MNVLKPHLQTTIVTLLEAGTSQREIARVTGIDRKTIRAYQQRWASERANSPGVATGSPPQTPPPRPPAITTTTVSTCEPYREFIAAQLRLRRNFMSIYQDLVDQFGFTGAYNSVKRFAGKLQEHDPEQFDRLEFAPGEEAQVDYGEGAPTRVPGTQRYRRPRLFVMTLRYSRRSFRRVVWKSSQETWAQLHEQAWRYFGGTTHYVVLDNLKEGVLAPDLYEPELNPVYAMVLRHYGVVADPARVRDPNRKGTVEHAIGHTQATALKGKRFESLEEQNAFLEHWETRWAAPRIHGSTRRQVEAMYQEERPHLQALPISGVQYFKEAQRTVCDDTCIRVDHSSYAARPARIGSRVLVRLFDHYLEIRELGTQALIRTHARVDRPGTVVLPDEERLFNPSRETRALLRQAQEIGVAAHQLCQTLFAAEGRVGQRKLWGIVGLARRYPSRLVEQACQRALDEGIQSYKRIKALTEQLTTQALEQLNTPAQTEPVLAQQHRLIRDGQDYADLFTLGAQQSASLPLFNED